MDLLCTAWNTAAADVSVLCSPDNPEYDIFQQSPVILLVLPSLPLYEDLVAVNRTQPSHDRNTVHVAPFASDHRSYAGFSDSSVFF